MSCIASAAVAGGCKLAALQMVPSGFYERYEGNVILVWRQPGWLWAVVSVLNGEGTVSVSSAVSATAA